MNSVIGTMVPVDVLHRLALGVLPIDALARGPVGVPLVVEREVPKPPSAWVRRLRDPLDPWPPGIRLEGSPGSRFRLRHGPGIGREVTIRIWDREKRVAPRRFRVPLWTLAELEAEEQSGAGDVPVLSRTLRPWLWPGTAASLSQATTGVRGRVVREGRPVPWARVVALDDHDDVILGRAAADERGEFVLAVTGRSTDPWIPARTSEMDVILRISADPAAQPVIDAARRFESLPVEPVPRLPKGAQEQDLNTPLLRGETDPAGFVPGKHPPVEHLPVGRMLTAAAPYEFTP